jgi:nucleotide-binding universal stress UspA family protein
MEDTMKMMVCYDGSNVAKAALDLAKKHAKAANAKIYLLTSMENGPQVTLREFENAGKDLKDAKITVRKDDIPCEAHLSERGLEPGEDLVKYAGEHQIDQIFIGVRRRSKVGKLIFGSTAQYVILNAPCPVVTVR